MDLNSQAAAWHARLRSQNVSAADLEAFERWLRGSDLHAAAYAGVSRTATLVTTGLIADPRFAALLQAEAVPAARRPMRAVMKWQGVGIAASLALVATLGVFAASRSTVSPVRAVTQEYLNGGTQQRAITLADGSTVHLDVATELTVTLSPEQRRVALLRGRASFEVAHDTARPFMVEAAGVQTLATGTEFEVQVQDRELLVTLAEGSVAVSATEWKETLIPGDQLVVDAEGGRHQRRNVDTYGALAWTRGRLQFDATPLGEALRQVNRYLDKRIVLGDEALAGIPVGGTFAAGGDGSSFVQALAAILPVEAETIGTDRIVLYPRRRGPSQQQ